MNLTPFQEKVLAALPEESYRIIRHKQLTINVYGVKEWETNPDKRHHMRRAVTKSIKVLVKQGLVGQYIDPKDTRWNVVYRR